MSSGPGPDEIARDARWLAQALDVESREVRLVEMDRAAYQAASFLDERLLQKAHNARILPWDAVAAALPNGARRDACWIFHVGHVGSTLVARMLGELPGVLSVREPQILRDVSVRDPVVRSAYTPALQALLSRTFERSEVAVVKATSFVSETAHELVPAGERALFMFATAPAYIASILAGENSRAELRYMSEFRRKRLASRGVELPTSGSDAHLAAAAWACEMTALEAAAEAMTDRALLWVDFDQLLDAVQSALAEIARFFDLSANEDQLRAVAQGPLLRRYSKALEYEYSPNLRYQLLREATAAHRSDIDSALAMLHGAAGNAPLLDRALKRSSLET